MNTWKIKGPHRKWQLNRLIGLLVVANNAERSKNLILQGGQFYFFNFKAQGWQKI